MPSAIDIRTVEMRVERICLRWVCGSEIKGRKGRDLRQGTLAIRERLERGMDREEGS